MRYRDPDCECEVEYSGARRIACEHCRTDDPLPGSFADPGWEQKQNDPAVWQEAHARVADSHPELASRLLAAMDHLNWASKEPSW